MTKRSASFQITTAEINRVVAEFYARVRRHQILGPVFKVNVEEWPSHEDKVARFWAKMILHEQNYEGNPLKAHIVAKNMHTELFEPWLDLFDSVLQDELSEYQASAWSNMVHTIGGTLRSGMERAERSG